MQSLVFPSRMRNAMAVLVSLLALSGLAVYLDAPAGAIAGKLMASYKRAARTFVEGVVKSPNGHPDRQGWVDLVFRNGRGRTIEGERLRVNRQGRFDMAAPKDARSVVLIAYLRRGRKAPHGTWTLAIVSGKALSVTVVFHQTGGSVLPALFPY